MLSPYEMSDLTNVRCRLDEKAALPFLPNFGSGPRDRRFESSRPDKESKLVTVANVRGRFACVVKLWTKF